MQRLNIEALAMERVRPFWTQFIKVLIICSTKAGTMFCFCEGEGGALIEEKGIFVCT
jgi:hypothetical protein